MNGETHYVHKLEDSNSTDVNSPQNDTQSGCNSFQNLHKQDINKIISIFLCRGKRTRISKNNFEK